MALRVTLAQINSIVGDFAGNIEKMRQVCRYAEKAGVDLIVFPELSVCGYPPEDLLLKKHFLEDNFQAVQDFAKECCNITVITGFAELNPKGCFNSAAILQDGIIKKIYRKVLLPNYGVFDERRYFKEGSELAVINIKGLSVVITICEDIWHLKWLDKFLAAEVCKHLIINISSSPFHVGKINERKKVLGDCAKYFNCIVGYCNLVGGQDEVVFDGRSMFVNQQGNVVCLAKDFAEDSITADIEMSKSNILEISSVKSQQDRPFDPIAEVYECLLLGTRDYVLKNGFKKVLIGLSGGIDSSLTAAIAADALGAENVIGITMPSRFNSPDTITDAELTAKNLGIEFHSIPIGEILDKFNGTLAVMKGWNEKSLAYENLQARIRGTILMSLSNKFGALVLTTGNKSETAVGYSTLYGDTAGGFAVIKDVPKTMVYQLSEYINQKKGRDVIPLSVIKRVPTAELRENQKDSDTLPEYGLLDEILKDYIEFDKSPSQMVAKGFPEDVVGKVVRMIDQNEYKRRQSPPGIKITPRAFGKDRRMPITNRYKSI